MYNLDRARVRTISLAVAVCVGLGTFSIWFALQVMSQWQDIDKMQSKAVSLIQGITRTVDKYTDHLLASESPNCDANNLKWFRETLLSVDYIADVGVLDSSGRMACSAVIGEIHAPHKFPLADIPLAPKNNVYRALYFDYPLYSDVPSLRVPAYVVGPYVVAFYPAVIPSILEGSGVDAVFAKSTTGYSALVGLSKDSSADPELSGVFRSRLSSLRSHDKLLDINNRAFFATDAVDGTVFSVQTNLPFSVFFHENVYLLISALLSSIFVGALTFFTIQNGLAVATSLRYRIRSLLVPSNIVCTYQPIIDLATMEVAGCEVLMRLKDRDGSILYPDTCIPEIIARGLTARLDDLVFAKATDELTGSGIIKPNFKVAFNFFPDTVSTGRLQQILDVTDLPHRVPDFLLDVEILEQDYQDSVVREVRRLKSNGILISVDDFGTGYSNLKSIQSIAPNFLKIDRSFVNDMEESSVRSSLIPEIISIARAVGAKVIAEGIENSHQLRLLSELGVEYGQGYYFAKPMPVAALKEYLMRYTGDFMHSLPPPHQGELI